MLKKSVCFLQVFDISRVKNSKLFIFLKASLRLLRLRDKQINVRVLIIKYSNCLLGAGPVTEVFVIETGSLSTCLVNVNILEIEISIHFSVLFPITRKVFVWFMVENFRHFKYHLVDNSKLDCML